STAFAGTVIVSLRLTFEVSSTFTLRFIVARLYLPPGGLSNAIRRERAPIGAGRERSAVFSAVPDPFEPEPAARGRHPHVLAVSRINESTHVLDWARAVANLQGSACNAP